MFSFVVKWLGFLKSIPLVAIVYDSLIKLWILITNPKMLGWIDELEEMVLLLPLTEITIHKYGGAQFNYRQKEFAHCHSNGILDVLLNREVKKELMAVGRIDDHHVFKNSGWISFYIQTYDDLFYAKSLLQLAYHRVAQVDGQKR